MWTKRPWGRFSPSTSVSPANHHSTNFSIIIINRGWGNRHIGGRSAEWTQLDSTPHYTNYKKGLNDALCVCKKLLNKFETDASHVRREKVTFVEQCATGWYNKILKIGVNSRRLHICGRHLKKK
jgi:hypothetical protein